MMKLNRSNAMSAKASLTDVLNSVVVAANVAWATILTGVLNTFDLFSAHAGPLAALAGFILSLVLIYVNIQNVKINNLQIENLQRRDSDKRALKKEAKKTAKDSGFYLKLVIVFLVITILFLLAAS